MPANLENSAVATKLGNVGFHSNPQERQCQRMFKLLHSFHILAKLKMKMKVAQLYLTLCDPMDYIAHGILQATVLEWVAIPFSRGSSQPRDRT